jgi:DNA-binding transcriptional regulator GbsR (MarR family)
MIRRNFTPYLKPNPISTQLTSPNPNPVEEARHRFIEAWGNFGSAWGINRTMAQIHALLLLEPEPLSAEQIMELLNISRGNVNMNLRALMDWGLVARQLRLGERREYFVADKDIWQVTKKVTRERKKRELTPLIELMDELELVGAGQADPKAKELHESVSRIRRFAGAADRVLEAVIRAEETWFFKIFMKLFR